MLVVAPASARGVADLRQLGWLHKGMRRDGRAEPGQTVCACCWTSLLLFWEDALCTKLFKKLQLLTESSK
jgi:hypothetical protein